MPLRSDIALTAASSRHKFRLGRKLMSRDRKMLRHLWWPGNGHQDKAVTPMFKTPE